MLTSKNAYEIVNGYVHWHHGEWAIAPLKMGPLCEAIAQAAEEDKVKAIREWCALRDEAQAQVAAMASALQHIGRVGCFALNDQRGLTELETEDIQEEVDKALSAAPKVLGTMTGRWRIEDGKTNVLTVSHLAPIHVATQMGGELTDEAGQEVEAFVVAKQGQDSEQGYKQARGVIPWKEGDELPEDVIARIRGRGQEG